MIIKENVGDRIIYKGTSFFSDWVEAEIMEFSPDWQQVKLKLFRSDNSEYIMWEDCDEIGEMKKISPHRAGAEGEK
jgi:hypothetical protein